MTAEDFKNSIIPFSRKIYPMMMRMLKNEEETKDAVQELMMKLWRKRHDLEKCENREAFMFTVARNHCFDLLKKKRPVAMGEHEERKMLKLKTDGENNEWKEKFQHVERIIGQLPENYKTIIRLRDIDGFSFDEIREMTGLEIPNIRVILSRARQKVKNEVEKLYDFEMTAASNHISNKL